MARHAEGWRLRREKGRETYLVRFRISGKRVERSTGCSDPVEAEKAAARIYSDFVHRAPRQHASPKRGEAPPLDDLISKWIAADSSTVDELTAEMWIVHGRHFVDYWPTLADLTDATVLEYRGERLRAVTASTVRKELSSLRRFLVWAETRGHLPRKVVVPSVPKRAVGTKFGKRRRVAAPNLSPAEIAALLAELPEWSSSRKLKDEHGKPKPFPIRARFEFAYATGLRPSTIDELSVPEHYEPGSAVLRLTQADDKARWGRELPLSAEARIALDRVCPPKGLIFGGHDYRDALQKAAAKCVKAKKMPAATAALLAGSHLRSAMVTHALEGGANLAGVMFLVGHARAETTSRYLRPSFRAAEAALESFRGAVAQNSGGTKKRRAKKPNDLSAKGGT